MCPSPSSVCLSVCLFVCLLMFCLGLCLVPRWEGNARSLPGGGSGGQRGLSTIGAIGFFLVFFDMCHGDQELGRGAAKGSLLGGRVNLFGVLLMLADGRGGRRRRRRRRWEMRGMGRRRKRKTRDKLQSLKRGRGFGISSRLVGSSRESGAYPNRASFPSSVFFLLLLFLCLLLQLPVIFVFSCWC